jgi:hypothetical protein
MLMEIKLLKRWIKFFEILNLTWMKNYECKMFKMIIKI